MKMKEMVNWNSGTQRSGECGVKERGGRVIGREDEVL
jgi:hypothetical protein